MTQIEARFYVKSIWVNFRVYMKLDRLHDFLGCIYWIRMKKLLICPSKYVGMYYKGQGGQEKLVDFKKLFQSSKTLLLFSWISDQTLKDENLVRNKCSFDRVILLLSKIILFFLQLTNDGPRKKVLKKEHKVAKMLSLLSNKVVWELWWEFK